jgi:hypothetical protein
MTPAPLFPTHDNITLGGVGGMCLRLRRTQRRRK